ncbi:CLUMA_CG001761, isoform A [Clunio marinus]|uniref:CLUMA_CG001761, isoform A n=1 Tax=Clunio marinus TaxID=568069 RepID=A0A1J1HIW0_9DIPT|nr:CLUMA_CG001761, isoform A [Clunio marinus]
MIFYFPLLCGKPQERKKRRENVREKRKICGFYCLSSTSFSQDLMSHKFASLFLSMIIFVKLFMVRTKRDGDRHPLNRNVKVCHLFEHLIS